MLADYLRGKTIDAIYASPMKRVQQTLAPTLKIRRPSTDDFSRPARN
jgi:broad specificity phosphatase PhoE